MNDSNYESFIQNLLDEEENIGVEEFRLKQQYQELLSKYLRRLGRSIEEDYSDALPFLFELIDERSKIKILEDALSKGIAVEQSKYYLDAIADNKEDNTEPMNHKGI